MDLSKDITLSCQIGVSACLPYAGLKDISTGNLSVYDGSWTEFKTYYKEWNTNITFWNCHNVYLNEQFFRAFD